MESIVNDRRLLLRHALQEYKDKGGQVTFPVGSTGFDDWLIDALDAQLVLNQINRRGKLDLIQMCSAAGTLNNSIMSRLPSDPEQSPSIFAGNKTTSKTGAAHDNGKDIPNSRQHSLPHLQLPSMAIDVDERDLQTLAFQIFLAYAGEKASPPLIQNIRAQLEINDALGKDLASVVALTKKNGITTFATLDGLVKVLQTVSPSAFQNFRSFTIWRSSIASILSASFGYAVSHNWNENSNENARTLLASLRGCLRRLDVKEADDFEATEYADATRLLAQAAGRLASNIQTNGLRLPIGINVQIAEFLLSCVFDSLDEGEFIPEAQELLGLLSDLAWPPLGISPRMNSALAMWVHFRQYMVSKEVSLLQAGAQIADKSARAKDNGDAQNTMRDTAFTMNVLDSMSAETTTLLSDYHQSFASMNELQAVLEFLSAIDAARGDPASTQPRLLQCIKSSVGAAFARRAAEVHSQVSLEEDRTALLATETIALLHTERSRFAPVLKRYQPAAIGIIAVTLHELYGAKMLSWLISVNSMTKSVAATIHASVDIEAELIAEVQTHNLPLPPPWGAVERVTPLMHKWADNQVHSMHEWLDRIMKEEDWSPVVQQRGSTSRSAVEITKVMDDAVETLFGIGISIPASILNVLINGMDTVLAKYCRMSVLDIGTADSLVPPAPPLTRYKKDIAEAAEAEAFGAGPGGIKGVTHKMSSAFSTSWLPSLTQDEQDRVLSTLYDTLVVRANSMFYLAQKSVDLEHSIQKKWEKAQEVEASPDSSSFQASGLLSGSMAAAADSADSILRFITIKLICGDLRTSIFKNLYAFNVQYYRIQPILAEVDTALGMLCEMLAEGLAPRMAGHVCKTLAAAVRHVLVDGGPHRLFTLQDMPILLEDFDHLKSMFYAEGAGLDPAAVSKLCEPLETAIMSMSVDTGSLIAALKNTKKQPLRASASKQGNSIDPELALRILCHRADYDASKYLKKDHKIPKKLPNVITASVSKSFERVFPNSGSATKVARSGGSRRMEGQ